MELSHFALICSILSMACHARAMLLRRRELQRDHQHKELAQGLEELNRHFGVDNRNGIR